MEARYEHAPALYLEKYAQGGMERNYTGNRDEVVVCHRADDVRIISAPASEIYSAAGPARYGLAVLPPRTV